jgi:6-phosphofructokinase
MKNVCYAQSGGPTAVINESARAVIETVRKFPSVFGRIFAGRNGISGILKEELIDISQETEEAIQGLKYTPSAAFGSCRHKLNDYHAHKEQYMRLMEVFDAHNIGYFFYNGGGDSQDTAYKIAQFSQEMGYPLVCIGIPKTIDNDLAFTDCSPGFASAAKYLATSIREASLDLESMAPSSTKVFVLETMGRNTGWLAAATGVATDETHQAPHIILLPEVAFNLNTFLAKVQSSVERYGQCAIVVSEGIRDEEGHLLLEGKSKDSFGHSQLGGVATVITKHIQQQLGLKHHWAVADYLQRSARHLASLTDREHAYAVGKAAVEFAAEGKNAVMPIIVRDSSEPYRWHIESACLKEVANYEKHLPRDFISDDGFHITDKCREYIRPLITGECSPRYIHGLPDYVRLKCQLVAKKL